MTGNAELRRNLWLELTPTRLVALPLALLLFLALSYFAGEGARSLVLSRCALGAFAVLMGVWAPLLAAQSITGEFAGLTWDAQRLLPRSAWSLAWGKLAGSTSCAWYGGALCLAAYLAAPVEPLAERAAVVLLLVLGAVWVQAFALLIGLLAARRSAGKLRALSNAGGLLLGGPVLFSLLGWAWAGDLRSAQVSWYGLQLGAAGFWIASLALSSGWLLLGIWRSLRAELQYRNGPWAWLGFVVFHMAYLPGLLGAGLQELPAAQRAGAGLGLAFGIALLAAYAAAFGEGRDVILLRRLQRALAQRRWRRLGEELPCWSIALGAALLCATAMLPLQLLHGPRALVWGSLSLLGFALRDLSLLFALSLGGQPRRAEAGALFCAGFLYTVAPALAELLELPGGRALFLPGAQLEPAAAVLSPLLQFAAAALWLRARVRRALRALAPAAS